MTESGPESPQVPPDNKSRNVLFVLITVGILIILGTWLLNYVVAERPLQRVLRADPRNGVVKARAHFDRWIDLNTLVFDVSEVSGTATRMDVFRCFLEYAEAMKDHHVTRVILAARGNGKFKVDGDYFQQLGQEYSNQNPMYTIRTFPTHLFTMDGTKPFAEYTGGILGVLQKEMEQFTEFSDQWYVKDFQTSAVPTARQSETPFDPCEGLRDANPHCGWNPHWEDSGVSTNAIDGRKTEFFSMESSDADGMDFGKLHYAELRICFDNGKLCGGRHVGVAVNVHGMVEPLGYETGQQYSTAVRLKFDDEKPVSQTWGIADSHDALFPYGREKQFLALLVQHNKLILEFSYYEKAARTVTFDISGLADKMKAANLAN
ncbi:MAG: hypothetical protein LAO03_02360 [Acidobacteriia bacterium]|nr:hypothetical protein [Terriglobia bacterium]